MFPALIIGIRNRRIPVNDTAQNILWRTDRPVAANANRLVHVLYSSSTLGRVPWRRSAKVQ